MNIASSSAWFRSVFGWHSWPGFGYAVNVVVCVKQDANVSGRVPRSANKAAAANEGHGDTEHLGRRSINACIKRL